MGRMNKRFYKNIKRNMLNNCYDLSYEEIEKMYKIFSSIDKLKEEFEKENPDIKLSIKTGIV